MTPKKWTRLSIALVGLAVMGYLMLLRPWSLLKLTPLLESRPQAEPARQRTSSQSERSREDLIRDTKHWDWSVRWDAVNELGKRKDRRAVPALVERALYDENPHPRWRGLWALKAVDRTGSEAVPLLRSGLDDTDPVVVRNAAVALAFFGQAEARSELLKGLKDYDAFRRWEAVFSLRKIGSAEVAEALIPLLGEGAEPEERVRSQVALTLGYMGGQRVTLPLLEALRTDRSSQVRWRAAMTLSRVGDPAVIRELEKAMAIERDPQVRKHIALALTEIRTP